MVSLLEDEFEAVVLAVDPESDAAAGSISRLVVNASKRSERFALAVIATVVVDKRVWKAMVADCAFDDALLKL